MGVTFTIKGEVDEAYVVDATNRNAGVLATMMHLDLNPDGNGNVGELGPFACAMVAARIDVLLRQDLRVYEIPTTEAKFGEDEESGEGLFIVNFGIDSDYIRRRLTDFYHLFMKAAELGKPVQWS